MKPGEFRDFNITAVKMQNSYVRFPECVSLPAVIYGGVYPRPDTQDGLSAVRGLQKRLIHPRPKRDQRLVDELVRYAKRVIEEEWGLVPLTTDDVPSFEEWLRDVNQPGSRKAEYLEAWERMRDRPYIRPEVSRKKCFVKAEFYETYKYHRIIHSPTDEEKVLQGRFVSAIEKKVFARPEFIKKVPRSEWPNYVSSVFDSPMAFTYGSDYKSFESNFDYYIMAVELTLARYMLSNFLHEDGVQDILAADGLQKLDSKLFRATVRAKRKSGQMSTSLFNGFGNIIFNGFVLRKLCGATEFRCVVEGDDGLFTHNGNRQPTPEDFEMLGLTIDIALVKSWWEASFCGVVTHPEVLAPLANPMKVLMTVSWASRDYIHASDLTLLNLCKIKGLSYLAQYPGCPVIQEVALWILRVTNFREAEREQLLQWYEDQRATTWWDRQRIFELRTMVLPRPIDLKSREVMESAYGLSVEDQVILEALFTQDSTGHVTLPDHIVPPIYRQNWDTYVRFRNPKTRDLHEPFIPALNAHPENLRWMAASTLVTRQQLEVPDRFFRGQRQVSLKDSAGKPG